MKFDARKGASDLVSVVELRDGISPGERYRYWIEAADRDERVGNGRFETAPARDQQFPDRFSFAIFSCHNPFDQDGRVEAARMATLRGAPDVLSAQACKRILWVGDQMYADLPSRRSLLDPDYLGELTGTRQTIFDLLRDDVRNLYQQRYRLFWNFESLQELMRHWSSHFIWDDHEIVDNFGCARASAGAVEERARRGFGGFLHTLGVESAFSARLGPRVVLSWLSMKLFRQVDGEVNPVYSGAAL